MAGDKATRAAALSQARLPELSKAHSSQPVSERMGGGSRKGGGIVLGHARRLVGPDGGWGKEADLEAVRSTIAWM